ncbi:MAG: hypothetical protein NC122_07485 [Faecalibacterium sp.]|nr:hypothetical protein [Ruminococcus sp.]MCM1392162.1 hypothetical protein [Ruminococcus sp.]MCM1486034.1 hypothetical protein [Faecalibacterium sp.]
MKKAITLLLALILVFSLVSCGGGKVDSSLWQANETFESVPIYEYGTIASAEFASECNIKIEDNSYDNFVKYIEDLKDAGFKFLPIGDIPENYNLYEGSAQWRCSNGKVYLQLIFNEKKSSGYGMFGCNLQIYGYSKKPDSWKSK